ncbi:hypothetical protein NMY22_g9633 [Coprinellus aureogranulatus]|nr:hypothetical protein NMY22_g9633 [Coprinellus aureogranulatus]
MTSLQLICKLLELLPKKFHCPKPLPPHQPPPPSDGYTPTFQNLTGRDPGRRLLDFRVGRYRRWYVQRHPMLK